jgi:hypothetical protein
MTDTPKLVDSVRASGSRQRILSRLGEAALISTVLLSGSAPFFAYAVPDGDAGKATYAAVAATPKPLIQWQNPCVLPSRP